MPSCVPPHLYSLQMDGLAGCYERPFELPPTSSVQVNKVPSEVSICSVKCNRFDLLVPFKMSLFSKV